MSNDNVTLSYTTPVTMTDMSNTASSNYLNVPSMSDYALQWKAIEAANSGGSYNQYAPKPAKEVKMKLVRYTVVDPDARLAKERPELCVLDSGLWALNGTEEKGLIMEISSRVAALLPGHNAKRVGVEYEDEDGEHRTLRETRLGQLDVVLEVLKTY